MKAIRDGITDKEESAVSGSGRVEVRQDSTELDEKLSSAPRVRVVPDDVDAGKTEERIPTNGRGATLVLVDSNSDESTSQDQSSTSESTLDRDEEIELAHCIPGRMRLRVPRMRWSTELAKAITESVSSEEAVTYIRSNTWCSSLVIEYKPSMLSEERILELTFEAIEHFVEDRERVNRASTSYKLARPSVLPAWLSRPLTSAYFLACKALNLVEKFFPPAVQLGVGVLAFGSNFLALPAMATKILVSISVAPIANRALQTLVVERKASVDALDGMAALMMMAHGRMLETSFMAGLIGLGEFIRERTARRCEKMVTDLLGLAGQNAWLVKGKKRICIPANEVKVGEVVVVYPGEIIPIDGIVTGGAAAIDQAKLTGESHPIEVERGSEVLASTVNVEGKIYVQCTATGTSTKAGKVIEALNSAPIHETKIQNYASVIADKMVLPIILGSAATFVLTRDIVRTMSMMIFDFTTGIRISAPTSVLASMHRAGRHGILIKSGAALEKLASVNAIVFDKTGTLTSGEPTVTRLEVFNGYKEDRVLQLASAVEQRLHHPASKAIVKYAHQKGLSVPDRVHSEYKNGRGIKAQVEGLEILVGSKRLMLDEGVDISKSEEAEAAALAQDESLAYIAVEGKLEAIIAYRDQIRPETVETIKQLKKLKVTKLVMATGDHETAAAAVAREAGITDVFAKTFPEEKADIVASLKAQGFRVAVIGDGINDSPALAHADVAISLHGGTEAARHSADVILTDDDLRRLPESIRIARGSMGLVSQNISLAIIPNSVGLGLAAFGLIGPAGATLLNNGSAICSAMNALRPLYSSGWSKEDPSELPKALEYDS